MHRLLLPFMAVFVAAVATGFTWIMGPGKGSYAAGVPTGNSFTIISFAGEDNTSSITSPAGTTGEIFVIWIKWEGSATLTSIQGAASGTATLRGSVIDHGNGDLHTRFATLTTTQGGAETISSTFSGTPTFRDYMVWRVSASGTIDYSIASGSSGTSTSPSTGNVTSATVNGLAVVGLGLYGSSTISSQQVDGVAATNTRTTGGSSGGWDLVHTSQVTSGAGTATLSVSIEWVSNIICLSAQ